MAEGSKRMASKRSSGWALATAREGAREALAKTLLGVALVTPATAGAAWTAAQATARPAQSAVSPAVAPVDPALKKSADDLWHFVAVARYELAAAELDKLASAEPLAVLRAFEAVASDRRQDLDAWVARWRQMTPFKSQAERLARLLDDGRQALREDQAFIEENIKRLIVNERAYQLAVQRLRLSGELAVPLMVRYLQSVDQLPYHGAIRRALTDMGKHALAPLLAATEMKDASALTVIALTLGDLGYDVAVPYLLRLASSPDVGASVRTAASTALGKFNVTTAAPADAFYQLGERLYYEQSLLNASLSQAPVAYVWRWSDDRGLTKVDVPPQIFNELMAMRAAEYALSLDQGKAEALSLWLAANYQREIQLEPGQTDDTRMPGQPDAHFYGVASGVRYVNEVLMRALRDGNSALALRAVSSLQEIAGASTVTDTVGSAALAAALGYPDRRVRFEAAYTVGSAMPAGAFPSSERVVPVLAEMINQTGKAGVLVLARSDAEVNRLTDELTRQGYNAVGATSVESAVNKSAMIPSVDAVVVSEDVGFATIDALLATSAASPRVALAPKVIITVTTQSPYAQRAAVDKLVNLTQSTGGAELQAAIDAARLRGGANPLDAETATESSLRALALLERLAVAKLPALSIDAAKVPLLMAMDDEREQVVERAARVLAISMGRDGQAAIFRKATAANTSESLRVSLLGSLAVSAKTFGNLLASDAIEGLEALVAGDESLAVRSAAAEARGALNLPPEQAKDLVLSQSRR